MATARDIYATETLRTYSSPNSDVNAEGLAVANETSPLLQNGYTGGLGSRQIVSVSEQRLPARSFISMFIDNNAGMFLIVASQFFYTAMNFSVKFLNRLDEPVPTLELICARMAMTYICSVSYMYWRKVPDPFLGPKGVRTLLVSRGLTGFIALAGMYFSLQHLSLSDAVVIKFIEPIVTGFLGAIFLKESLTLKDMLTGFSSFFGVLLIARPQILFGAGSPQENLSNTVMSGERMQSVTAGLIGVLGATSSYTLIRAIGKRAHPLHVLAFFSSECVVISSIGMIIFKTPLVIPTRISWLVLILLVGIFGLFAQVLLAMGLQRETVSRGTLALYTSIIFAVIFEFAIFHTTPSALSIYGTIIIMSSAIYISLAKKPVAYPTHNPAFEQPRVTLYTGSEDDPEA